MNKHTQADITIKCSSCQYPATYNVERGDIRTHMCKRCAEEMQRDYGATITPIRSSKTQERKWTF